MYHYLYKITNNVNGRIYIGVHSAKNLFDGYMGSGTNIIRAIKKYGVENFTKKILYRFADRETLMICENVVVDNEFISRDDTYNIRCGGAFGPFGRVASDSSRKRMSEAFKGRVPYNKGVKMSEDQKKKLRLAWKTRPPASAETNKKISESLMGRPRPADVRAKISEKQKGVPQMKVKCPHCGVIGGRSVMQRHHFKRCKENKVAINEVMSTGGI